MARRVSTFLRLAPFAASLLLAGIANAAAIVSISQLRMDIDDSGPVLTRWGSLVFEHERTFDVKYLNVSVNGSWQVQNVAITPISGSGNELLSVNFNLGSAVAGDMVSYGWSLTDDVDLQPLETANRPVLLEDLIFRSGKSTAVADTGTPAPAVGGKVAGEIGKAAKEFPNQEVGTLECGPGAVSNSLQYLKQTGKLNVADGDITIDKMKVATGWTAKGVGIGWWKKKDQYMKDKKIPVKTEATKDPKKVIDALKAGKDVEVDGKIHVAAVVSMKDLGGGKYEFEVAHDTSQNKPGGTKKETGTYDSNTGLITGITWLDGKGTDDGFVIESPVPEPTTMAPVALGVLLLILRRARTGAGASRFTTAA